MSAKTSTERQNAFRKRRAENGLQEVRGAWAHPDDHAAVKALAAKLTRKRNAKAA